MGYCGLEVSEDGTELICLPNIYAFKSVSLDVLLAALPAFLADVA